DHTEDTFNRWCGIWLDPHFKIWNIESSLPGIRVPILALMGEADQYGTLAQIDTIKRALPELTDRVVLAECGHSPHLEQPGQALAQIHQWLRQADAHQPVC
ncbi:MAG: alpha/beta hydrolase, partial [Sedimenticola sp.]|nr:alpha/beta hydrolase [Sedimenticola sp.]